MSLIEVDTLHRTAKQLFDSGTACSLEQAQQSLERLVLQVDVGAGLQARPAEQAALMTVVNAGARAFLGGVHVRSAEAPRLSDGWGAGDQLSDVVERLGGIMVEDLDPLHPTVAIKAPAAIGSVVMHVACSGWSGGVLQQPPSEGQPAIALAGVCAGGLAVSEAFQHSGGAVEAARRDVGLSLWSPGSNWRSPEARGPILARLPSGLWLFGLGHLGQGEAWSLGMLPYADPAELCVYLMDTDSLIPGNLATGLLSFSADVESRKTRTVAKALERLGVKTAIVERRFDGNTCPTPEEPSVALAGFDSPLPRRQLGGAGLQRVVDAGLGNGPADYLDMVIHTFPSQEDPTDVFPYQVPPRVTHDRYESEVQRMIAEGVGEVEARCGMTEIAGVTVAAAFVGAVAGSLMVADVLRLLHGGIDLAILSLDLRTPETVMTVENSNPGESRNPGFTLARTY